jgi:cysteine desulfurase
MTAYLDNNSTAPLDPKVKEVLCESTDVFGNINSIYKQGIECRAAINSAYDTIYDSLNASDDDDIIFTSSTTEGNNAVIKTFLEQFLKGSGKNHIIATVAEHSSIKSPLAYCKSFGMEVTYIGTDENGLVSPESIKEAITDKTALITVLAASNETGAIQPIKDIAKIARGAGVPFHSDGAQAIGKIKVDLTDMDVDYFTWSAHKFHGPKGVGGLFIKKGAPYSPLIHGAKNVMAGMRGGSIYNNGVIAMAKAIEIANSDMNVAYMKNHVGQLRDILEASIAKIPDTKSYVPKDKRLPNIVVASFKGIEGESMLWDMDQNGIHITTGSSCSSEDLEASAVVEALGEKTEIANATVMFALSRFTTHEEIEYVMERLPKICERLREISMTYAKQEAYSAFVEDH